MSLDQQRDGQIPPGWKSQHENRIYSSRQINFCPIENVTKIFLMQLIIITSWRSITRDQYFQNEKNQQT